jgi:hypothetical protein
LVQKLQLEKIGECLQESFAFHADDEQLGRMLAEVSRRLRSIAYLGTNYRPLAGHTKLSDLALTSITDMLRRINEQIPIIAGYESSCQPLRDKNFEIYRSDIEDDQNIGLRPYLWIAAASGLAYYHDYAAALKILDDWIRAADSKCPDEGSESDSIFSTICPALASGINRAFSPILIKVFKLRVRTLIASYIEEWNNYQPVSKTEPVLRYHADNMLKAIALGPSLITVPLPQLPEIIKINFAGQIDRPETVEIAKNGAGIRRQKAGKCEEFRQGEWPLEVKPFLSSGTDRSLTVENVRLAPIVTIRSLKEDWLQAAEDQKAILRANKTTAIEFAESLVRDNLFCLALLKEKPDEDPALASGKTANEEGRAAAKGQTEDKTKEQKSDKAKVNANAGEQYVRLERSKANYYFARAVLLQHSEGWADEIGSTRLALLKHTLQAAQSAVLGLREAIEMQEGEKTHTEKAFLAKISSTEDIETRTRLQLSIEALKKIIDKP